MRDLRSGGGGLPSGSSGGSEPDGGFDCRACGACCAYSADWPRFSTESEEALDRLPAKFVADDLSGMRCEGTRCSALVGTVAEATRCTVYADRPDVCRACVPGGDDCRMARAAYAMAI